MSRCRAETQQKIANYIQKHPQASSLELKLMTAQEIELFKAKIAPLVGGKSSTSSKSANRKRAGNARREARKATTAARKSARGKTATTMAVAFARSGSESGAVAPRTAAAAAAAAAAPAPAPPRRQWSTPKVLDPNEVDAIHVPTKYFSTASSDTPTTPAAEEEPVVVPVLQTPTVVQTAPAPAGAAAAADDDEAPGVVTEPVKKTSSFETRPTRVHAVADAVPPAAGGGGTACREGLRAGECSRPHQCEPAVVGHPPPRLGQRVQGGCHRLMEEAGTLGARLKSSGQAAALP